MNDCLPCVCCKYYKTSNSYCLAPDATQPLLTDPDFLYGSVGTCNSQQKLTPDQLKDRSKKDKIFIISYFLGDKTRES